MLQRNREPLPQPRPRECSRAPASSPPFRRQDKHPFWGARCHLCLLMAMLSRNSGYQSGMTTDDKPLVEAAVSQPGVRLPMWSAPRWLRSRE